MYKNYRMAYGYWGGQCRKPCARCATTTAWPSQWSQCTLVVPPMPTSLTMVPPIPTSATLGIRCCPHKWEGTTTLCLWGPMTATCNVRGVSALEWHAVHPLHGRGSPNACGRRHGRPACACRRIIPEIPQIFTTMPVYLSEPYQKTGFIILCRRITSSVMAGFLNKIVLLLSQCTNIAREQIVVACG